jgi:hypothetical protein
MFRAMLLSAVMAITPETASALESISPEGARAIAKEAVIYGFPLVDNYRIQYSYFVDRDNPDYKAPWNTINNVARVFTPEDKAIQTPNSDTPYSQLGADLRREPLVISVPEVKAGRYYSLQFVDMYTFNFAYVGSRATGSAAGHFLLAGPRWSGEKPAGITAVIQSETDFDFVQYRTQLFNAADIDNVEKVQAGYKVEPLSQFLGQPAPPAPPAVDFIKPLSPEDERTSPKFFDTLNFVLQFCPIHPSETELMARFARLGIGAGKTFNFDALTPELQQAVRDGMADAWKEFAEFKATQIDTGKRPASEGFGTREFLKSDYMARMAAAALGIYGNSKEEALYPAYFVDAHGEKLNGSHRYALSFTPDQLPPVNSFWSLTVYELPASLLYANPIHRYLINSPMLPGLKRDADGKITIYLEHESPGKDLESNWLPIPAGPFWATLRLYWPKPEALDGRWKQPPLERLGAADKAAPKPGGEAVPVTVENFARAESDLYFGGTVKLGGFAKFYHNREPTPIDQQTVVRMNRDTLYSAAVFDLDSGPVTITLPDPGKRFMSMQVINEDQYTPAVRYAPGRFTFTPDAIGTRYVIVAVRTLVDPANPDDLAQARALQDTITADQPGGPGTFEIPNWDPASQKKVRDALNVLADTLPDKKRMFGSKGEVDPVRFVLGAASAWGGNPDKEAIYLSIVPSRNDGATIYRLSAKDVPVDGFWSVSVYNAQGYFEANSLNAYNLNSITAKKNDDGSVSIQFGGCDGKIANCLPIMPGWNYMVRLYRPRAEILDGLWTFPTAQPLN